MFNAHMQHCNLNTASCYFVTIEKKSWVWEHNALNESKELDMPFVYSDQLVQVALYSAT